MHLIKLINNYYLYLQLELLDDFVIMTVRIKTNIWYQLIEYLMSN